jgi:hypothetical protein
MAPHGIRPLLEGHFTRFGCSVQVKPREDRFSLRFRWHVVTGEVTEALVILKNHAAMLLAIPQASLGLNADIATGILSQHVLHVADQRFPAGAPVLTHLLFGGMAAGRAKYQRTHGAC